MGIKTQDRHNPVLYIRRLGLELSDEIRASLQQSPREYLFTEARIGRPYTVGGFQKWASRTLQALFRYPHAIEAQLCFTYVSSGPALYQRQRGTCKRYVSQCPDSGSVSVHPNGSAKSQCNANAMSNTSFEKNGPGDDKATIKFNK